MTATASPVQPIVVFPVGHEETILAAGLASSTLMLESMLDTVTAGDRSGEDPWPLWLLHSFTKSVRRARRQAERDAILELADTMTCKQIVVGDATAFAFEPMPYEKYPRAIKTHRSPPSHPHPDPHHLPGRRQRTRVRGSLAAVPMTRGDHELPH